MADDLTVYAVYDYHDLVEVYVLEADALQRRSTLIEDAVRRRAEADGDGPDPDLRWKLEGGITVEPLQVRGTYAPPTAKRTGHPSQSESRPPGHCPCTRDGQHVMNDKPECEACSSGAAEPNE